MIKRQRHFDFIISFLGDCVSITWQVQYYEGAEFLGERHWTIGLGLCFPPFIFEKGGDKP